MTDIEIANSIKMKRIEEIGKKLGLNDELEFYGKYKAKIDDTMVKTNARGKLILVTAVNPTPFGEGKTTVSIGLLDALCFLKKNAIDVLREPS